MNKISETTERILTLLNEVGSVSTYRENIDFNILTALHLEYREVYICRLIGEILKDEQYGGKIRRVFAKEVLGIADEMTLSKFDDAIVLLEEKIDEERRVDIVIKTQSGDIFPIEAKIYAGDQPNQLYDYWHYYKNQRNNNFNENSKIYYLTPNGHEPSENSIQSKINSNLKLTKDKEFVCISFNNNINNNILKWIDGCLEIEKFEYILKQFKDVIRIMSANDVIASKVVPEENPCANLEAMKNLLNSTDTIMKRFRRFYFDNTFNKTLNNSNNFIFKPCDEIESDIPKEVKIGVISRNDKEIANVLYETNLFIRPIDKNGIKENGSSLWEDADSRAWQFLRVKGKKIVFNDPRKNSYELNQNDVFDCLEDLLNSIE